MSKGTIFWVLMILVAVLGYLGWSGDGPYRSRFFGGFGLVLFVLLFLLGWQVFGFVVQ